MHTRRFSSPALTPSLHGPSRSLPPSRGGMSVCLCVIRICVSCSLQGVSRLLPPSGGGGSVPLSCIFSVSVSLCFCVSVSLCLCLFARPVTLTATLSGEVCLCLRVSEVLCSCVSSTRKGPSHSIPPFRVCVSISLCLRVYVFLPFCNARHADSHPPQEMGLCRCFSMSLCLCVSPCSLSPS